MIVKAKLPLKRNSFLTVLLFFGFVYFIINFVLTPNAFFPVHQDDYILLGRGVRDLALFIERPVTLNIAYLVSELGVAPSFLLVSMLVITVPMLIVIFLERLFDIKFQWYSLVLFAAITFGHFSAFENGKYLGSVVGLSGLLGTFTLLTMILAFKECKQKYIFIALIGYGLTSFSREDFLIPPFILLVLFYLNTYFQYEKKIAQQDTRIYSRVIVGSGILMLLIAFLSILLSVKVGSRFANMFSAGPVVADPYAISLTFNSLINSFRMLSFGFIFAPTIFALLGVVIIWFTHTNRRLELIAVVFIVVALMLPYTMIPNNLPAYRVVSWLPWFAAIGCIATQAVIAKIREQIGIRWSMAGIGLLIGISFYVLLQYDSERRIIANWYSAQQVINKNIIETLRQNNDVISRESVVGIRGIEGLSPWGNTDAEFLGNKLGFKNKWILFVSGSNAFNAINYNNKIDLSRSFDKRLNILVAPISEMCDMPDMLVINFDKRGIGESLRTNKLCGK